MTLIGWSLIVPTSPRFSRATRVSPICAANESTPTIMLKNAKKPRSCGPWPYSCVAWALRSQSRSAWTTAPAPTSNARRRRYGFSPSTITPARVTIARGFALRCSKGAVRSEPQSPATLIAARRASIIGTEMCDDARHTSRPPMTPPIVPPLVIRLTRRFASCGSKRSLTSDQNALPMAVLKTAVWA